MRELVDITGLRVELSPDPTMNPITRVRLQVDPAIAAITAWDLADALVEGERPIMVWDDGVAHGYFELDSCNLSGNEPEEVAAEIIRERRCARIERRPTSSFAEWSAKRLAVRLAWPDRIQP